MLPSFSYLAILFPLCHTARVPTLEGRPDDNVYCRDYLQLSKNVAPPLVHDHGRLYTPWVAPMYARQWRGIVRKKRQWGVVDDRPRGTGEK